MRRGGNDRDYRRVDAGNGTLMRHILLTPLSPSTLPSGMKHRPAIAQLVA